MNLAEKVSGKMPEITVLDGYTLNPGDLTWERLQRLGECVIYDRTAPDEVVVRAKNSSIVLTNKTVLNRAIIEQLPELRYIGVLATGYNVVDVKTAVELGITVTNIPAYGTESVAQMTFALLLELVNRVGLHAAAVKSGEWNSCPDFCFTKSPLVELAGQTFGAIGYGKIGCTAAKIARAFGMNVVALRLDGEEEFAQDGTPLITLPELLRTSDVISLHCPLTNDNFHLIGKNELSQMKKNAFLINTARGQLIDSNALAEALRLNLIAGAAIDVVEQEPPASGNPLIGAPNCIVTPHIAWATGAARKRLLDIAVDNLISYLGGTFKNQVLPSNT